LAVNGRSREDLGDESAKEADGGDEEENGVNLPAWTAGGQRRAGWEGAPSSWAD
jgi:hypothetical protein